MDVLGAGLAIQLATTKLAATQSLVKEEIKAEKDATHLTDDAVQNILPAADRGQNLDILV